jgi:hypothetical protein
MKLVFPDPCWDRSLISGALFLYFHDEKVGLTLHPSVSTFLTGIDPFDFIRLVEARKPHWMPKFSRFIDYWRVFQSNLRETSALLEPLRGTALNTIWMSYPKGAEAWDAAEELLASSDLPLREVAELIDPFSASDELFAHIFFERYLELYEGHRTPEQMFALGAEAARSGNARKPVQLDWTALYAFCNERFHSAELEALLATAYMFRLPILRAVPTILLSNPNLVRFLASLPVEANRAGGATEPNIHFDVVAWEFFRQLVSPRLDPLNAETVQEIVGLTRTRLAEIDRLKRRCLSLAEGLGSETNLEELQKRIRQHIRAHVEPELQAVLSLDKKASREFLDSVFSDEKTWLGVATFVYSLLQGGPALTAAAAIYALSSLGSKAVKAAATRRQKLEVSDFALLYRIRK